MQENGQKCVNPSDESVVGDGELRGGEQDGVAAAAWGPGSLPSLGSERPRAAVTSEVTAEQKRV